MTQNSLEQIGELAGLSLEELYTLPLTDEKTLKGFADDDLTGIFQFEGRATRNIVRDIYSGTNKIPDFMTLADINALSRPGSLISGMTSKYIEVERGAKSNQIHPVVDQILAKTNGCLVYQEQVMIIGREFGGLKESEIGRLRKIIGSKQAGGAFDEFWFKFRDGAKELHDADEDLSRQVWDYMAASASYLFNIAHAISYAVLAYWTMYLKVNHPVEFFAASLASAATKGKDSKKADPQLLILQDAVRHGLTVSPPHPALSGPTWEPNQEGTGVIAGFSQLPGIGMKTALVMADYVHDRGVSGWGVDSVAEWGDFVGQVSGFGAKRAENARKMCAKPDPFDIQLTDSATHTLREAIFKGDVPLSDPDATSASIPAQVGQQVTYIGHVVTVKVIDVINEMRQRKNMTTEEVLAELKSPEKATKAKIICVDEAGGEVHVNVNRFRYADLRGEIEDIDAKKVFVIHAQGEATNNFGPAIQAQNLTSIEITMEQEEKPE